MKIGTLALALILSFPIGVSMLPPLPPFRNSNISTEVRRYHILETLTIYNPDVRQCDDSPLITANNSHIDLDKLHRNEIRWMALSRNLLKRWNGEYNYGDTVVVNAGDPLIDGLWVIKDSMNKRFKDRGDLLFHRDIRATGIWKDVRISRWDGKTETI